MDLKTKFRPKSFKRLAGNPTIQKTLGNLITKDKDKVPRTMMIHGDSGCGKTTIGRMIALEFGINSDIDLHEMDAAQYRGVNDMDALLANVSTAPVASKYKMYLLDEVHMLSKTAQESLLKRLEHPPKHVFFILCTTEPKKLIATVRSRCTEYKVQPLTKAEGAKFITVISKKAKLITSEAITNKVMDETGRRPRAMLTAMQKLMGITDELEALSVLNESLDDDINIYELTMLLIKQQGKKGAWKTACDLIKASNSTDAEAIRRSVLGITSKMMLTSQGKSPQRSDWTDNMYRVMSAFEDHTYDIGMPGVVLNCYYILYSETL